MARFVASSPTDVGLPEMGLPEIAFIGRSNVGKSSLLNMVMNEPRLVRVSRTPGRTQALNLFSFEERLALVDMPGYGYAKVSKAQRAAMQKMIRGYVLRREALRGVVLLVDARRDEVSELDRSVAQWVIEAGRPLLVVITKADLVPKNRRKNVARTIEAQLGVPKDAAILCSSETREGREELVRTLFELTSSAVPSATP